MRNKKFGITFKTFSVSNMSSAFLDMDDTEPEDEIADALCGESPDLESQYGCGSHVHVVGN
eukprot:3509685-Pleurochrysis_carterae.AAC.1